ncbi:insulin-like growth factor-binding protein 1 [Scleropages formosus]|uniref:Insulin-like growth factor-binding protein 1 n=1 Tax=Scleropages formosus TaxID=113540 RepID=A0A8C9VKZ5_SCLFO|nr:insulin-like growth factor-binding protein 1 [Scleropages formosus]
MSGFARLSYCLFAALLASGPLARVVRASSDLAPKPIRCAPCTPERLRECPPVAPECADVQREPGCGCCSVCALSKGERCGVYTAHCGIGLRCTPEPNDPRPIHTLIHGQAICTESSGPAASQRPGDLETTPDQGSVLYMLQQNKPGDPKDTADGQESIRAKINAIQNKLVVCGPCHKALHQALDTIAASQNKLGEEFATFYLPNCDKHGFYKAKQCESSLEGREARCWCVSSWNGQRIAGTKDLLEDTDCQLDLS